jgi:hypothetical protein
MADVGWDKEDSGISLDKDQLATGWCFAPYGFSSVIDLVHRKYLVVYAEGRVSPSFLLDSRRQCETNRPQPINGRGPHRR